MESVAQLGYQQEMVLVYAAAIVAIVFVVVAFGVGAWMVVKGWIARNSALLREFWETRKALALQLLFRITPWPVYYWHIERDCDHYWVERPVAYPNGWTAWKSMNNAYDNAEGPCSFTRLTKAEYLEAEGSCRDAAAEAMGY